MCVSKSLNQLAVFFSRLIATQLGGIYVQWWSQEETSVALVHLLPVLCYLCRKRSSILSLRDCAELRFHHRLSKVAPQTSAHWRPATTGEVVHQTLHDKMYICPQKYRGIAKTNVKNAKMCFSRHTLEQTTQKSQKTLENIRIQALVCPWRAKRSLMKNFKVKKSEISLPYFRNGHKNFRI